MRKIFLFSALLISCTCLFAQNQTDRKGKMGFIFYFTEFDLKSFEKKLAGKYWWSNSVALNLAVDFNFKSETEEHIVALQKTEMNQRDISLSTGIEKHLMKFKNANFYAGLLFSFSFPEFSQKPVHIDDYSQKYFQISIPLGVEYRLSDTISLAGQHSLSASFLEFKKESDDELHYKKKISEVGVSAFYLILSVYFH